jgi:hypothetical protein
LGNAAILRNDRPQKRYSGLLKLVNDEEQGGCLIPMMMLCHEHDEDPEMRPKPISPEKREEVIVHMAAGLLGRIGISERTDRSVPLPAGVKHDAILPRSGATTRIRAARGGSTNAAPVGQL